MTGGVAHTLSSCWIELGKLAAASKLLDEIDPKAVAQLTGLPDWSANLALSRGEIAYRQGDLAAARKFLELAAPVLTRADAEMYQKQAVERLRRQVAGGK